MTKTRSYKIKPEKKVNINAPTNIVFVEAREEGGNEQASGEESNRKKAALAFCQCLKTAAQCLGCLITSTSML